MKTIARIPFAEIDVIPELIKDFLNGEVRSAEKFSFSAQNIEEVINKKGEFFTSGKRKLISDVLTEQNTDLTVQQRENLKKLTNENTFTICTGHQLNFFSGPVFFVYKILQAIKTCEYLEDLIKDKNFVPIFWMASEDHDFEEIQHFQAFGKKFKLNETTGGAVGRIKIQEDNIFSAFEKEINELPFAHDLLEIARSAYQKGHTLAEATRSLVQKLFSQFGLLVLDGDDPRLKAQMSAIFRDELLNSTLTHKTAAQVKFLTEKYGKVQVNHRDINLFYLTDLRQRIEEEGDFFKIVDTEQQFSKNEFIKIVENFPERISPNALMRPVFQEMVLPNVAYVGGNAEIMYWLQLMDYFQFLNIPFPVLIPRSSILILSEKQNRKRLKLEISEAQLVKSQDQVINQKILEQSSLFDELAVIKRHLISQFVKLESISQKTDVSFGNLVQAEKIRQMRSLEKMQKRLLRAERRKHQTTLERIRKIYDEIHPQGKWQERTVNFSEFFLLHGNEWLETCFEEINPTQPELVMMVV